MGTNNHSNQAGAQLKGCRVGANPIVWINDDFPEMGDHIPLERCLGDLRDHGYEGIEMGRKLPRKAPELAALLAPYKLALVSGWHSTYLASESLGAEEKRFLEHLDLLQAMKCNVAIVAECTRCVHGNRTAPLRFGSDAIRLTDAEWEMVAAGLTRFAALANQAGMKLVYHHHMGTVIQEEADLDRLLQSVPSMHLLLDAGHLAFAGIDPLGVLAKYGKRVAHVHLKSTRPEVAQRARSEGWSFYQSVSNGVFTIPGDGMVDYPAVFKRLEELGYQGWLVVEAEEDPVKADPTDKAIRARQYIKTYAGI